MAFQNGTITNSHELAEKIYGFLLSIGWQLVAEITDGGGNDYVFYSSGDDGKNDIYIRVSSGLSDKISCGDIQFPYSDGYTGYINGFAYQFYPENGTSDSDGYNRIGKYGPILYMPQAQTSGVDPGDFDEYNLWMSPENTTSNLRTRNVYDDNSSWVPQYPPWGFDGVYYIYHAGSDSNSFRRVNLFDNSITSFSVSNSQTYSSLHAGTGYVKLDDGNEYIYWIMTQRFNTDPKNKYLVRLNLQTLDHESEFSNDIPFTLSQSSAHAPRDGFILPGIKRNRNGHRLLYVAAGNLSGTFNSGSTEWTYVDAETGKWHESLISPSLPWNVGLRNGAGTHGPNALYVSKEMTGYDYDRIYVIRGSQSTNFASVSVDDDGYVFGSWYEHEALPIASYNSSSNLVSAGNSLLYITGYGASGDAPTSLYKWEIPATPEQAGTWTLVSSEAWTPEINGNFNGMFAGVHEHYLNRVKVQEFGTNEYWLFADKYRLTVVVKNGDDNEYNYLYTGMFDQYSRHLNSRLIKSAESGDKTIKVDDSSIFVVGSRYMIADTKGAGISVSSLTGENKNVAPSEIVTIASIRGNELTISPLLNSYSNESLIGEDPIPIMCRVSGLEYAQTFDVINKVDDYNFKDQSWQRYRLTPAAELSFANATDEGRDGQALLYGIVLLGENDTYTGKEVRGQMRNVYSCGTGVTSEDEVLVGSQIYIVFDIGSSGETQRIVVGPK
jgi:hypothetical protein